MTTDLMFSAHNIFYCPDYLETKSQELCDEIMVPMHYFHKLMGEFDQEEVLYITVRNTVNTVTYLATMGVPHEGDPRIVYIPQWMMNALGVTESTAYCIELEKTNNAEFIPIATKIVLRDPHIEVGIDIDVCELVEKAMVNLHSIQQGIELPIWVLDMEVMVYIERVDPGSISRIIAGDVEVEFVSIGTVTAVTAPISDCNELSQVSPVSPVSPYIPVSQVSQVSQVSPYIPEIDINCEPIITRIPSVPSVPRASSLQIAHAWDFYQGEERQKFIRQARLRHFY